MPLGTSTASSLDEATLMHSGGGGGGSSALLLAGQPCYVCRHAVGSLTNEDIPGGLLPPAVGPGDDDGVVPHAPQTSALDSREQRQH